MSQVISALLELFRAHSINAVLQEEWIIFPNHNIRANAEIVRELKQENIITVQLDVRVEISSWQTIMESFAGFAETREQAVTDALNNFTSSMLHVLLAAFFLPPDDQVAEEQWHIGDRDYRVIIGNAVCRGKLPVQGQQPVDWFDIFEQKIKQQKLGPGTHWVRLYYAQMQGKAISCEVILDNEIREKLQTQMAAIDWPSGEEFYSTRIFLIIQDQNQNSTGFNAESAVVQLAQIVAADANLSEEEIYQAMAEAGIPDALADRAFKFTQIAWGRIFLDGMGIDFPPDYFCFDAQGRVVESGRLADEPCFAVACGLCHKYIRTPAFQRLALTSTDVQAVNEMLHKGSKPEKLIMCPASIFIEAPTPAGMERVDQMITEYFKSRQRELSTTAKTAPASTSPNKPWWRFWG